MIDARRLVLRLLVSGPQSEESLARQLRRWGHSVSAVRDTLRRLRDGAWIEDARRPGFVQLTTRGQNLKTQLEAK